MSTFAHHTIMSVIHHFSTTLPLNINKWRYRSPYLGNILIEIAYALAAKLKTEEMSVKQIYQLLMDRKQYKIP